MKRSVAVLGAVALLTLAAPASADAVTTQTFSTSQSELTPGSRNQGWWSPTISNNEPNDNYIAQETFFRNFFSFDLTSACRAVGVTLRLTRFDQTSPLTYSLFDVSTPTTVLNATIGTSQAIYDDLGTGVRFGRFSVPLGPADEVLAFPLDGAGVAAFNLARGGFFSIGGSTSGAGSTHWIYGFSGPRAGGVQALVATCGPMTSAECKGGGWRDFGVFGNQGDCVSYVATVGRNQPAKPA
jgi:hypothetical protein